MKFAKVLRAILAFAFVASAAFGAVNSPTTFVQYVLSTNPQALPTTFVFQATADLLVLDSKVSPPVTLTLNSDYTVSGGGGATGTVTTIAGGAHAVQVGDQITISRAVPLTQTTNFSNTGPLTAAMIGSALDKLTMISQQLNLVGARSMQFQPDETGSGVLALNSRKNNLLGFDANGAIKWYATPGSGGVGTVTSVATGTGLTGGTITTTGTISLANTVVTPGSYTSTNITVDQQGRITAAASGGGVTSIAAGTGLSASPSPITSSGTISLANTAVTPGSYTTANITVDQQGRITAATSGLPDVQIFGLGTSTWTKPTNAKVVFVYIIGSGGGGGSGRRGAAGTYRGGGGGGAGGSFVAASFPASILGSTETVFVGAGGAGGAAITVNSTDGNTGSPGNNNNFGDWLFAVGGNYGSSGSSMDGAGGAADPISVWIGGSGGNAGTTGVNGTTKPFSGAGGGGGGSLDTSNLFFTAGNGASGGRANRTITLPGGQGALSNSAAGGAGSSGPSGEPQGGGGGGGGGGGPAGTGGIGGAGGLGGGGGGGGASANGFNSGAGGAGGTGVCVVISIF